jgi:hypothetical protein
MLCTLVDPLAHVVRFATSRDWCAMVCVSKELRRQLLRHAGVVVDRVIADRAHARMELVITPGVVLSETFVDLHVLAAVEAQYLKNCVPIYHNGYGLQARMSDDVVDLLQAIVWLRGDVWLQADTLPELRAKLLRAMGA